MLSLKRWYNLLTMKLYLIRHAKTDPQSSSGKDFDRKLLPRGTQQALDLSVFLSEQHIKAGKVLCSSAVRTRETWKSISPYWNGNIEFLPELYLCDSLTMLQLINSSDSTEDLMVIGHNEGISELATYLTGTPIHMQTGMLVELNFQGESWQELTCESATLTRTYRSSAK
jgi:phosphohistidine phosphatase